MKKILIFLFLPVMLVTSCVDSLDTYNISQKSAPSGLIPPSMLVSNAIRNYADLLTTPNVNTNNFRLYVQQWATTTYTEEPRYNLTARTIPQSWWQTIYRDVLSDLGEAKRLINLDATLSAPVKANQLAVIAVVETAAWTTLVNTFGDVPYTQALDFTNSLPVYDDSKTIFYDQLTKLDAAIASITTTSAGITAAQDLVYAGNMTNWRKFANSLKLKLAMVIADSDGAKSKSVAESAVATASGGLISANTENAKINGYTTSAPNNNPVSNNLIAPFTTRQDFVVGRTIVNKMKDPATQPFAGMGLNDPRAKYYFTTITPAAVTVPPTSTYVGGNTGFPNTFASTSKPSTYVTVATAETLLLDWAEVEFLLAEAAARGYTIPTGDVVSHYNAGITASVAYWYGLAGSAATAAADAAAYLLNPDVAYATASAYVTSNTPTNTQQGQVAKVALTTYKQKIGEQKYLALYNRGYESWVEWRRLDAPTLFPVQGGSAPAGLIIPNRLIFPVSEQTQNGKNWTDAAAKFGGAADNTAVKLFWDKF